MKIFRIVLIVLAAGFVILMALFAIYLLAGRQGVVEPYDLGESDAGSIDIRYFPKY